MAPKFIIQLFIRPTAKKKTATAKELCRTSVPVLSPLHPSTCRAEASFGFTIREVEDSDRPHLSASLSSRLRPIRMTVEFWVATVRCRLPLSGDPAFLLELMQGEKERSVTGIARNLLKPLADWKAISSVQEQDLQEQHV
jgi:hypothetical protein